MIQKALVLSNADQRGRLKQAIEPYAKEIADSKTGKHILAKLPELCGGGPAEPFILISSNTIK